MVFVEGNNLFVLTKTIKNDKVIIIIILVNSLGGTIMAKYVCVACGYVYDEVTGEPENGIAEGTKWENVPSDYTCPICGVGKDMFELQ